MATYPRKALDDKSIHGRSSRLHCHLQRKRHTNAASLAKLLEALLDVRHVVCVCVCAKATRGGKCGGG